MRRLVANLETWPERVGSLTEADRDLLKWLRALSAEACCPDGGKAAVLVYYRIHREIGALIGRKLRAERRRAHHEKTKAIMRRQRGAKDWQVRLVRTKAYELGIGQRRRGREEAARLAQQDFPSDEQTRRVVWQKADLRSFEQRAVAILGGAPRTARKNFLEAKAITLADAVRAEWFSPGGKQGRPAGSKIKLARRTIEDEPKVVSVAEAIETVLPTIEQLAGPKASSSPRSTMIKAIVSAVRSSAGLICTADLAANVVRNLRRTSRSSTT